MSGGGSNDAGAAAVCLEGDAARAYARAASVLLRRAPGHPALPPLRRLRNTLAVLAAQDRAPRIFVDRRTGLPSLASLTRAKVRAERAGRTGRAAPADVDAFEARVLHEEGAMLRVRIQLYKIAGDGHWIGLVAHLRWTRGAGPRWIAPAAGCSAEVDDRLRTLLYTWATHDSELSFTRLADLDGIEVERIERGVVGPLRLSLPGAGVVALHGAEQVDPFLAAWTVAVRKADHPLGLLDLFSDACVAGDDPDHDNDPRARLLEATLSAAGRASRDARRMERPYGVVKDRWFVATPPLDEAVRRLCRRAGTSNRVVSVSAVALVP
ncbi:MAG: hypothetical protein D6705_03980 [Deltaproteobacteria bacterium]|nr:MAG: hypothetical protein D6705_03980 [Deltaproteobacteria bacterium]